MLIAIVILGSLAPASAQESSTRRGVPRATRDALVGCWQLPDDEVLVVETEGESGLRARWRAVGRGGPESYAESMRYRPSERVVIGGCGPRTQHGQHCRFRVEPVRARDLAPLSGSGVALSSMGAGCAAESSSAQHRDDRARAAEERALLVPGGRAR